jgi:hypothetical protein
MKDEALRIVGREQYSSEEFVELVVRTDPCPLDDITLAIADRANI